MRPRPYHLLLLLIPLFLAAALPGCTGEQIRQAKATIATITAKAGAVQAEVDQAVAEKAELDARIAAMDPGPERDRAVALSAELQKVADVGRDWISKANESLSRLNAKLADADDALDLLEAGVEAAEPAIPVPWGSLVGFGSGLVFGLIRAWRTKTAAKNVVTSVQPAVDMYLDPDERPERGERRKTLVGGQTEAARRLVNEARGKKSGLPF